MYFSIGYFQIFYFLFKLHSLIEKNVSKIIHQIKLIKKSGKKEEIIKFQFCSHYSELFLP